jgi:hypothetical protein
VQEDARPLRRQATGFSISRHICELYGRKDIIGRFKMGNGAGLPIRIRTAVQLLFCRNTGGIDAA